MGLDFPEYAFEFLSLQYILNVPKLLATYIF